MSVITWISFVNNRAGYRPFFNEGYSSCIAGFMYPMHDITELYLVLLLNEFIFVISKLFIGERFSLGVGE